MRIPDEVSFQQAFSPAGLMFGWRYLIKHSKKTPEFVKFERDIFSGISDLSRGCLSGTYETEPYKHFIIHEGKRRDLFVPNLKDKLIQTVVYLNCRDYLLRHLNRSVYSGMKNKGLNRAILRIQKQLRITKDPIILHLDIKKCYQSIDHQVLKTILASHSLSLSWHVILDKIIAGFTPGIPLGNITSQIFANLILGQIDLQIIQLGLNDSFVRYGDDFFIIASASSLDGIDQHISHTINPLKLDFKIKHFGPPPFQALGIWLSSNRRILPRRNRIRIVRQFTINQEKVNRFHKSPDTINQSLLSLSDYLKSNHSSGLTNRLKRLCQPQ